MSEPPIDHFGRMNAEFYAQEPADYFRDRLDLLALRVSRRDSLRDLIAEGLAFENIRVSRADDDPEVTEDQVRARTTQFLITESQVLMHHCAEALIRLFLGHMGRPECPWLEVAALQDFRVFREQLDELTNSDWPQDLRDAAADVFLGGVPAKHHAGFDAALTTVIRVIRMLASRLSADKALYNSAKHGMTVIGGEGSVFFVDQDGAAFTGSDGAQVVFLEKERISKREARWHQTTKWLNPEQAVWLTQLAITQMDALWTVARGHYLGEPLGRIPVVTEEAVEAAANGFPRPGPLRQWRLIVATETTGQSSS